jgi:hypothetical protein
MGAVLLAWLTEIGVQTYKGGKASRVPPGLPVPSLFVADMIVFGVLAFGAKESAQARMPVSLIAWGLVIATLTNQSFALGNLSTKLAGGQAPTGQATGTVAAGSTS